MDRLEFFKAMHTECKKRIQFHGPQSVWGYITHNLQYLIDLLEGRNSDHSELANIAIGAVAVREIQLDDEIVEQLLQVQGEVKNMIYEFRARSSE